MWYGQGAIWADSQKERAAVHDLPAVAYCIYALYVSGYGDIGLKVSFVACCNY